MCGKTNSISFKCAWRKYKFWENIPYCFPSAALYVEGKNHGFITEGCERLAHLLALVQAWSTSCPSIAPEPTLPQC